MGRGGEMLCGAFGTEVVGVVDKELGKERERERKRRN